MPPAHLTPDSFSSRGGRRSGAAIVFGATFAIVRPTIDASSAELISQLRPRSLVSDQKKSREKFTEIVQIYRRAPPPPRMKVYVRHSFSAP